MEPDKIYDMWRINFVFQKAVVPGFGFGQLSYKDKVQLTKEYLLHGITETDELLGATGDWKTFGNVKRQPSISGITQELVDKFKFLINIALIWGINTDMFIEEFEKKTEVNWQKFAQQSLPSNVNDKIAVFDLDGVLCQYPEHWLKYLNDRMYNNVPEVAYYQALTINDVTNLHNIFKSYPTREYRVIKDLYREGGLNQNVPVMSNARKTLEQIRKMGYKIIIMTRRPVQRYKRIYADTLLWLRAFSIPFDGIYWVDGIGQKYDYLAKNFNNIAFVVEDDPIEIKGLICAGFKVYILDRPYNKTIDVSDFEDSMTMIAPARLSNLYDLMNHIKEV